MDELFGTSCKVQDFGKMLINSQIKLIKPEKIIPGKYYRIHLIPYESKIVNLSYINVLEMINVKNCCNQQLVLCDVHGEADSEQFISRNTLFIEYNEQENLHEIKEENYNVINLLQAINNKNEILNNFNVNDIDISSKVKLPIIYCSILFFYGINFQIIKK